MIDRATQERIKAAADIVEVVQDYVQLTKRGRNYMGLCPFHNERTPSFSVSRERNFCYCFSCHKGGSPVNFIMEKEGLSYHDALLQLAKKYGIPVEERELTDEEKLRQNEADSMYAANEWAMKLMENWLHNTDEGRDIGLSYLYGRGVTQEAVIQFRLGYVPDSGRALLSEATKAGFDLGILEKIGLVGQSSNGEWYDKFRGRVIFPIQNTSGKVIGFGGRDLKGGKAKYINSPASPIYNKSQELYGIYQAKNAISREKRCFLVEGYMDVIGMWQAGMRNVVASSGTALTDGQIALIHRFCPAVTLIYDGDSAGIHAALRGTDMLLSHQLEVGVLLLPDNDDPDSFARKHTAEEFKAFVEQNETDVIRFKTRIALAGAADDPRKRTEAIHTVVDSLACVADEARRYVYIQECSTALNVPERLLATQVAARIREKTEQYRKERIRKEASRDIPEKQPAVPTLKTIPSGAPQSYPLSPYEQPVITLCARYGMMDFCDAVDADGHEMMMSVVDYVRGEMETDGFEFTVPVFRQVFDILVNLQACFATDLKVREEELAPMLEQMRREGVEEIANKAMGMSAIQKAEAELEAKIDEERRKELRAFSENYADRYLASHEDDVVRAVASKLLCRTHSLSKIYERRAPVETEADRLPELLPQAITVWKQGILDVNIAQTKAQIREATQRNDWDSVTQLQAALIEMMETRSALASVAGERVIAPKR